MGFRYYESGGQEVNERNKKNKREGDVGYL